MKRLLPFSFVLVMALCLFNIPANATDSNSEISDIQASVESFLRNYTEETMLYEDNDLTSHTVADAVIPMTAAVEAQSFQLSTGPATLVEMQDNISFVERKAEYYKGFRQLGNIYRTGLNLAYTFESVEVNGDTATATVSELATFTYTDCTEQSIMETIYTVDLVNISGEWLVADITDNDWFDAEYKGLGYFDVASALADIEAEMNSEEACSVTEPQEDAMSTMTTANYRRTYSGENAAAYAYTYTRQATTESRDQFYNQDFRSFANDGGDCMNFASQSMWSGFYGSQQSRAVIDSHILPMDSDGTYKWYGTSKDSTDKTASWTSCENFRNYLTGNTDGTGTSGSNAADDIGMKATIIDVPSNAAISGTTKDKLIGAIAHVKGSGGPYAHAIILTDATALTRDKIWYCAHTTDSKYIKLGDSYGGAIKVFIPQYIRCSTPQTNIIKTNMLRPISIGTTKSVSFSTDKIQNKMTIIITSPSGTSSQQSSTSSSTCSISYKFNTAGLYKVDCYAKTTSTSTAAQTTFYILAYSLS